MNKTPEQRRAAREAYVHRVVSEAPELNSETIDRIVALLRPAEHKKGPVVCAR